MANGSLFSCETRHWLELRDDGSLGPADHLENVKRVFARLTFDESTGTLRWAGDDVSWGYQVMQIGNTENGLIAIRHFVGPASVVVETLNIGTWMKGTPFFYANSHYVFSGTCKKV